MQRPSTALYNTLKTKPINRLISILLFAHQFCSPEITLSGAAAVPSLLWASGPSRDSMCLNPASSCQWLKFLYSFYVHKTFWFWKQSALFTHSVERWLQWWQQWLSGMQAKVTVNEAGWIHQGPRPRARLGWSIWGPCLQSTFSLSRKQCVSPHP